MKENKFTQRRKDMVQHQIVQRGIAEPKIVQAFSAVPRHLFIPEYRRIFAYNDFPVSIGEGQTISQPYIVALMTKLLELEEGQKVLEIGTGSGYQAAILAQMEQKSTVLSVLILWQRMQKILWILWVIM